MVEELRCGVALCVDGLTHGFAVLDDGGIPRTALCGSTSEALKADDEDGLMCPTCVPLIAAELGIDPAEFIDHIAEENEVDNGEQR